MNYSLSLSSVKMIPFDKYEQNFTFIVNGKRYKTSRVIADLLSPTIRNYHFQDPTIDEFTINTTNNNTEKNSEEIQKEDYFNEFLNLFKLHHLYVHQLISIIRNVN